MPYASAEVKRIKQAEYREKNRAKLCLAQLDRERRLKENDREAFLKAARERKAKRVAEGRHDYDADAARARSRYALVKDNPDFKKKNVARAVDWRRRLDLNAPENLHRRVALRLRSRLRKALARGCKTASAVKDLGCSVAELIKHIELQFQDGMSWDNHGEWHIDHIKPLASFDLTDETQAKAACHYSNLQPLWASENHRKWCHVNWQNRALTA